MSIVIWWTVSEIVETERLADDAAEVKEEVWCKVNESVGLEKCKQAL
jgi:hypothetical protein